MPIEIIVVLGIAVPVVGLGLAIPAIVRSRRRRIAEDDEPTWFEVRMPGGEWVRVPADGIRDAAFQGFTLASRHKVVHVEARREDGIGIPVEVPIRYSCHCNCQSEGTD